MESYKWTIMNTSLSEQFLLYTALLNLESPCRSVLFVLFPSTHKYSIVKTSSNCSNMNHKLILGLSLTGLSL